MSKTNIIKITSTVLCFIVLITSFALYRRDAEEQKITLSFGEIKELNIGDITSTSQDINPENSEGSFTVVLSMDKTNDDQSADKYEYGRFYIEFTQADAYDYYLKDQIEVTAAVKETEISQEDILKTTEAAPKGFVTELSNDSVTVTVKYNLSEEAKNNFVRYAEQSVTVRLHWEFCESPQTYTTVHVYGRWEGTQIITYEAKNSSDNILKTDTLKLMHYNWTILTIDDSVTAIRFIQSDVAEYNISLKDVTAKEVWVLYGDNEETVYIQNPEQP